MSGDNEGQAEEPRDDSAGEIPTTALIEPVGVGVYYDMPAEVYHSDPVEGGSLSHSIAKLMIPPSCPAKARYAELNRADGHKNEFDFGRAAHTMVFGTGEEIVEVKANNWRSALARETKEEARAAGKSPVLSRELGVIEEMADVLRNHPVASALLAREDGNAEVTLVWEDQPTKLKLRGRVDWLRTIQQGRRTVVSDYKSAKKGDPVSFAKSSDDYCYHSQGHNYVDGIKALFGVDAEFVFVVQEVDPPYVVSCYQLDHIAKQIGMARNRWARDLYAKCKKEDHWPGYVADQEPYLLSLPRWTEIREGFE